MPPTATPTGTIIAAEDLFIEGAPEFWFGGDAQYNPDADGYYHGVVGTAATPLYKIGCYEGFTFSESVTVNEIRCDTVGLKKTSQQRDYLMATFDAITSLLGLRYLYHLMKASPAIWNDAENSEKMGIGEIDNTRFHRVFFSRIYDSDTGDFVSVTGHRCQFTGTFSLATPFGNAWRLSGVEIRFYADEDKPAAQRFATMVRVDPGPL